LISLKKGKLEIICKKITRIRGKIMAPIGFFKILERKKHKKVMVKITRKAPP